MTGILTVAPTHETVTAGGKKTSGERRRADRGRRATTKFALALTFTPQMKGEVILRVKAGLASSTFYVDPKAVIS